MASDPSLPLQAAIYEALTADVSLMEKITGVFDSVPESTGFPYITIGEGTMSDLGAHTFDGAETNITIHTWARGRGRKQTKEIMADVYRILHDSTLDISGHILVLARFDFAETMLDPDGVTYHGVQRFRFITRGK